MRSCACRGVSPYLAVVLPHLFFYVPASAVDMDGPARVRVCVRDPGGRGLEGAVVTVSPNAGEACDEDPALRRSTGADGAAEFELHRPEWVHPSAVSWSRRLRVELAGRVPHRGWLRPFPDAEIEKEIVLAPARTTLIRLRGPDGRPFAGVELSLSYSCLGSRYLNMDQGRTDARGEYLFVHARLRDGFSLRVGGLSFRHEDIPEVTVTMKEHELQGISGRRLEGILLGPDGAPAVGWLVAEMVEGIGGGGPSGGPYTEGFAARELTRLRPDGRFTIGRADECLAVISPRGVPFLFPLDPETWSEGVRRVTLRLPPIRRIQEGRLLREYGTPAAQVPVIVVTVRSRLKHFSHWSLNAGPLFDRGPLWLARARDGAPVGVLRSDDEGRYELPIYVGSRPRYGFPRTYGYPSADLAMNSAVTIKRLYAGRPTEYKRLTFVCKDERGRRIPDMGVGSRDLYAGEEHVSSGSGGHTDSRGCHLFVPLKVDRIDVRTRAHEWKSLSRTFDIPAAADRTFDLTVPEGLRLGPLRGVVLDADGRPVAHVQVSLYRLNERKNYQFLGFATETDEGGRFAFEAAPDECLVRMYRYTADGNVWPLPGWLPEPPAVTKGTREITIRLMRPGSVKALLPGSITEPFEGPYLYRAETSGETAHASLYHLEYDGRARALRAPCVPPGSYELRPVSRGADYEARGVQGTTVEVRAGEETVVQLHERAPHKPWVWTNIAVLHEGEPVSGAAARVFYNPIDAGAGRPAGRELWRSGEGRLALSTKAADLSDEKGRVRFRAVPGREYVVVARQPGRLIGWKSFSARPGAEVKVELVPARTLVVRLNELELPPGRSEPYEPRNVWLRLADAGSDEAVALLSALDLYEAHVRSPDPALDPLARLDRDGPLAFVAEDLPVEQRLELHVRTNRKALAKREVKLSLHDPRVKEILIDAKP